MSESGGCQIMERDRPGLKPISCRWQCNEATNHIHFILLPQVRISAHGNYAARHAVG